MSRASFSSFSASSSRPPFRYCSAASRLCLSKVLRTLMASVSSTSPGNSPRRRSRQSAKTCRQPIEPECQAEQCRATREAPRCANNSCHSSTRAFCAGPSKALKNRAMGCWRRCGSLGWSAWRQAARRQRHGGRTQRGTWPWRKTPGRGLTPEPMRIG